MDQGMEGLFKQAAEQAHFAFDEAAWSKMETILDTEPPVVTQVPKLIWPQVVSWATIVIAMLLLFKPIVSNYTHTNEGVEAVAKSIRKNGFMTTNKDKLSNQAHLNTPRSQHHAGITLNKEINDSQPANPTEAPTSQSTKGIGGTTESPEHDKSKLQKANVVTQSTKSINKKTVKPVPTITQNKATVQNESPQPNGKAGIAGYNNAKKVNTATLRASTNKKKINTLKNLREDNEVNASSNEANEILPYRPLTSKMATIMLSKPFQILGSPDSVAQPQPYELEPSNLTALPKWSVLLFVAPDLNVVSGNAIGSPGPMAGLSLEYALGQRWSITAGLAHSIKKYGARGSDYTLPDEPWAEPENLDFVDASCNVIDIPINLRYYFTLKQKTKWYGSMGLSSYLMLREDYEYDYNESYSNPGNWESWGVRNENQHYAGILNLSLGYEQSIGNRMGIGIEPFVKIPLARVGAGKVKLVSLGTLVNIRYNLGNKKPKRILK